MKFIFETYVHRSLLINCASLMSKFIIATSVHRSLLINSASRISKFIFATSVHRSLILTIRAFRMSKLILHTFTVKETLHFAFRFIEI